MRESLSEIEEYVPGRSIQEVAKQLNFDPNKLVKLSSNESPLGLSPNVSKAICEHLEDMHIYPEVCSPDLRSAISEYVGYPLENIVIGNGGDGVLDTIVRLFVDKSEQTIIPIPTFSFYELTTRISNGIPKFIKRNKDFSVPLEKLISSVNKKTKIIFLCTPNNPSGNIMSEKDVRTIVESVDCIVVCDEAYVEFTDSSCSHLVREYKNLIVTRTFSKAFGLAGLRIGYAIIPEWIFGKYMKVNQPFGVNKMGVTAGIAALKDKGYLNRTVELAKKGREFFRLNIPFKVYPSEANFVLIDVSPLRSKYVLSELLKEGIIVRDCSSFRGAGDSLIRITVGTEQQNEKVVHALNKIDKKT